LLRNNLILLLKCLKKLFLLLLNWIKTKGVIAGVLMLIAAGGQLYVAIIQKNIQEETLYNEEIVKQAEVKLIMGEIMFNLKNSVDVSLPVLKGKNTYNELSNYRIARYRTTSYKSYASEALPLVIRDDLLLANNIEQFYYFIDNLDLSIRSNDLKGLEESLNNILAFGYVIFNTNYNQYIIGKNSDIPLKVTEDYKNFIKSIPLDNKDEKHIFEYFRNFKYE